MDWALSTYLTFRCPCLRLILLTSLVKVRLQCLLYEQTNLFGFCFVLCCVDALDHYINWWKKTQKRKTVPLRIFGLLYWDQWDDCFLSYKIISLQAHLTYICFPVRDGGKKSVKECIVSDDVPYMPLRYLPKDVHAAPLSHQLTANVMIILHHFVIFKVEYYQRCAISECPLFWCQCPFSIPDIYTLQASHSILL